MVRGAKIYCRFKNIGRGRVVKFCVGGNRKNARQQTRARRFNKNRSSGVSKGEKSYGKRGLKSSRPVGRVKRKVPYVRGKGTFMRKPRGRKLSALRSSRTVRGKARLDRVARLRFNRRRLRGRLRADKSKRIRNRVGSKITALQRAIRARRARKAALTATASARRATRKTRRPSRMTPATRKQGRKKGIVSLKSQKKRATKPIDKRIWRPTAGYFATRKNRGAEWNVKRARRDARLQKKRKKLELSAIKRSAKGQGKIKMFERKTKSVVRLYERKRTVGGKTGIRGGRIIKRIKKKKKRWRQESRGKSNSNSNSKSNSKKSKSKSSKSS